MLNQLQPDCLTVLWLSRIVRLHQFLRLRFSPDAIIWALGKLIPFRRPRTTRKLLDLKASVRNVSSLAFPHQAFGWAAAHRAAADALSASEQNNLMIVRVPWPLIGPWTNANRIR